MMNPKRKTKKPKRSRTGILQKILPWMQSWRSVLWPLLSQSLGLFLRGRSINAQWVIVVCISTMIAVLHPRDAVEKMWL